ncbi:hypothetical protein CERZMDRAFT_84687 [Cercospora zeae-maydis SCOH1-5]|uniref:Uncharacterized protein n=1 Tax=Cercospora zeae-maydis SCOH1-5 TaxID=717836 RepID=A0A6A6FFQ2_9PEZI|nr:hypothetical protein CERZMDRAFT_84687 [Cercospora zeae-maydis SCOH1-5]
MHNVPVKALVKNHRLSSICDADTCNKTSRQRCNNATVCLSAHHHSSRTSTVLHRTKRRSCFPCPKPRTTTPEFIYFSAYRLSKKNNNQNSHSLPLTDPLQFTPLLHIYISPVVMSECTPKLHVIKERSTSIHTKTEDKITFLHPPASEAVSYSQNTHTAPAEKGQKGKPTKNRLLLSFSVSFRLVSSRSASFHNKTATTKKTLLLLPLPPTQPSTHTYTYTYHIISATPRHAISSHIINHHAAAGSKKNSQNTPCDETKA